MFEIVDLALGNGRLGVSPIPGKSGRYESDLSKILRWGADMVLTMTTSHELERVGASRLGDDLAAAGVEWRHLPVPDFGAPPDHSERLWPEVSETAADILAGGGRVLSHCYGGCGRAGMVTLRLMVEAGEEPEAALARLREVRPCAVQSEAQFWWSARPASGRAGRGA